MDTLDFEVEIGLETAQGYPVNARGLGSGEAATSMRLPLTSDELDYQLAVITDAVLASSAVVRRIATREEQPVQQLGRQLFEGLLSGDVRELFGAISQRARQEGHRMRLVLRVQPPELARLPWEFLFDPGRQDYLGLSMPLVRHPQVLAPQQPLRQGRSSTRALQLDPGCGWHDQPLREGQSIRLRRARTTWVLTSRQRGWGTMRR
jgi:hypothetical protein